jgi:hypothetical protein
MANFLVRCTTNALYAVLQAQSVLRERVSVRQRPRQSHVQNLHPSRKLNQLQNCLRLHLQQFRQLILRHCKSQPDWSSNQEPARH